jgi:hypothetical protein
MSSISSDDKKNTHHVPVYELSRVWISALEQVRALRFHFRFILIISLFCGLLGVVYSFYIGTTYTAKASFVIEENKQSSGGLFSALAGQIGLDMSSISGSSGLLAGDNILELAKSQSILKAVMLSSYPGDTLHSLAWHYSKQYKLQNKFSKLTGKTDFFSGRSFTRIEDSLMKRILMRIKEKELSIYKPDRKLSVFNLEVTTKDEVLSSLINSRLIEQVSKLYIKTKTERLQANVDRLQHKADSIVLLLNSKTYQAASKNLLNANPVFKVNEVDLEISSREKSLLSVIYGDLSKSLDISKTALIQETPTIEVIDNPEYPLDRNEVYWYVGLLYGIFIGSLIGAAVKLFF